MSCAAMHPECIYWISQVTLVSPICISRVPDLGAAFMQAWFDDMMIKPSSILAPLADPARATEGAPPQDPHARPREQRVGVGDGRLALGLADLPALEDDAVGRDVRGDVIGMSSSGGAIVSTVSGPAEPPADTSTAPSPPVGASPAGLPPARPADASSEAR